MEENNTQCASKPVVDIMSKATMYIESDTLQSKMLISEEEEKAAQTILKALEGHYIIRAEKILDFCKLAVKTKKL